MNFRFLLPALQIQTILEETTRKGMKRALRIIPKSLDLTFRDTLNRLSRQSRSRSELGISTLMWISHARRPLLIGELQQALAIDSEDEELDIENYTSIKHILECCLGLVTVDEESSSIRLVHYSVQEYLQKNKSEIFPDAECSIAQACLAFLMFKDFMAGKCSRLTLFDDRVQNFPFLLYAAQFWADHVQAAPQDLLSTHVMRFTKLEQNISSSEQAFLAKSWYRDPSQPVRYRGEWEMWFERIRENQSALHILSKNGLSHLANDLLRHESVDVNSRNSHGETPLLLATLNQFDETVQILLDAQADGDIPDVRYGDTPLILAINNNSEEIVQSLLKSGVSCNKANSSAQTPLLLAITNDASSIVETLLQFGASPEISIEDSQSKERVLVRAQQEGQIEIVLTNYDMDGGQPSHHGNTSSLQVALDIGNVDIVRALLSHGAKCDEHQRKRYTELLQRKETPHNDTPEMGIGTRHPTPEPTQNEQANIPSILIQVTEH